MNNQNFEFKSYIATPTDQYMLGLAKVKLYGKVIATYKHVKTKDGTSTFFCSANYTMTDATGEKKYQACIMLDSRDDEEELLEFIRRNVNQAIAQKSAHKLLQESIQPGSHVALGAQNQYYPHGMAQNTHPNAWPEGNYAVPLPGIPLNPQMNLPHEVAADEQIPF